MGFLKRAFSRRSKQPSHSYPESSSYLTPQQGLKQMSSDPYAGAQLDPPATSSRDMPPAYTSVDQQGSRKPSVTSTADSPYSFLGQFDTVFLVDDSGSMAGRNWRETATALSHIAPVCTAYDSDGIDMYFLNHYNPNDDDGIGGYKNVTTLSAVQEIFGVVRPGGGTPTGQRLNDILKPYLHEVVKAHGLQAQGQTAGVKPLNIIVITDGVPTDDPESAIVSAAKKLDQYDAEPWQIGIQFFQVGQDASAQRDLQELDDALSVRHHIRDMVDTEPWNGENGAVLDPDRLLKVVLGSVNRRLDRR